MQLITTFRFSHIHFVSKYYVQQKRGGGTERKTQFPQGKILPGSQKLPRNSVAAESWWGFRSPRPRSPHLRRLLVRRAHSKQVVDFQPTANSANNSIHSGTGIATPEAFLNQRPCRWDFLHGDHPNVICSGVFASIALRLVVAKPRVALCAPAIAGAEN